MTETIWEPLQMCGAAITDKFNDNSKDPIMQDKPPTGDGFPTSTFDTGASTSVPLPTGVDNPAGRPPPSPWFGEGQSATPPAFWIDLPRFLNALAEEIETNPELQTVVLAWGNKILAKLSK